MEIVISFGNEEVNKKRREYKGKSYIDFPDTYCILDLETTGLSPEWDSIIEIGAIKYANGVEIEQFQSLVQPEPYDDGTFVDDFITALTGITNDMLSTAPETSDVIREFSEFLEDNIIIGYNVSFDVNFLYDNFMECLKKPMTNSYIDAMRMARKLYPKMKHHRLKDMANLYNIINENEHRAIGDCLATAQCYKNLYEESIRQFGTAEAFISSFKKHSNSVRSADIHADNNKMNKNNPLFDQHCVFTGKLEQFTRREAMQIVANLGGINQDNVTKKTNYLILGNNDYCATIKDGKSRKQKKAEEYILKGQDIKILSENTFYDLLNENF